MNKILLAVALFLMPAAAVAETISSSGTQPYACTVVGDTSIVLGSSNTNLLSGSGSGSISQNGDTVYTMGIVGVTGPDVNVEATTSALGTNLNVGSTESASGTQAVTGEVSENVSYSVTVSSSDGVLSPGAYTTTAELTCAAQ